ncbi:MAG: hypothetical protein B7Y31_15205 [Novosphingobium sp. 16-62-11]|nr:MAG: hypothetical protein B7Y31_15205 [Novosphingobium sp. 16-62-11]
MELQFPSNAELLARVIQGYDFKRSGSETSTRDGQLLLRNIYKLAERFDKPVEEVAVAAERLRNACRLGRSIDAVLEQYDHDPLVLACGKLAITFFIGQAESRSSLKEAPRVPGELPLRLPWQKGEAAQAEWGVEQPWNIHTIATQLSSLTERRADRNAVRDIRLAVASAQRIVFLGFGFQPQNVDLLFENSLSHNPDVLISTHGVSPGNAATIALMMRRLAGLESDHQLMLSPGKAWEVLRDYSLLLES